MNRIKKYFRIFIGIILFAIIITGVIYLINPSYIENIAYNWFSPKITIEEKYAGQIVVETPEVYELMQIAYSLTPTFQKDPNLIHKGTEYYEDFENHFMEFKDHELIDKLNEYIKSDYLKSQLMIRLLSLNYKIDNQGKLKNNGLLSYNPILAKLAKSNFFINRENIKLIKDFIAKSEFKEFYKQNRPYYEKLINNYNELCDFHKVKNWLNNKFSTTHHSYRIIFSPLTGGLHNTMSLKSINQPGEQIFMFVSAPSESIDSLNNNELEIKASQATREVFTEIDHQYVNPLTDKYISEMKSSMSDYKEWSNQKNGLYTSKYKTFNEYMTWGVFNLYALDTYSKRNIDTIIEIQSDFMRKKENL
mgnify:FL=1